MATSRNNFPGSWRTATIAVGLGILASGLGGTVGCSSGSTVPLDPAPSPTPAPVSGTFFGADRTATGPQGGYTLGRSFVTVNAGVPQAVGFELTPEAIVNQPTTPIADANPNIYFVPLPAEGVNATTFKTVAVFYFTGHPVDERPQGEPEHFHVVFMQQAPHAPSPPDFQPERMTPAPEEVPPGIERAVPEAFLPGIGVNYDDPTEPAGQAPRTTIGLNYLYYQGHMNGFVVGGNSSFLQNRQTYTRVIPQPQIYPTPGYYPQRVNIRYDAQRNTHVFELTEFRLVTAAQARKKTAP